MTLHAWALGIFGKLIMYINSKGGLIGEQDICSYFATIRSKEVLLLGSVLNVPKNIDDGF